MWITWLELVISNSYRNHCGELDKTTLIMLGCSNQNLLFWPMLETAEHSLHLVLLIERLR